MRLRKLLLFLIGYGSVVALSFFIITGTQKLFPDMTLGSYAIAQPGDFVYVPAPTPNPTPAPMPVPQPPAEEIEEEPQPRIITLAAEGYYVEHGFEYTVFVGFGDFTLSFHIEYGLDMGYAMETVYSIVDLFDLVDESFPGWPFFDYFVVAEDGNMHYRHINYNFASEPEQGFITHMFFSQVMRYSLPWWLCIGLEAYLLECTDVTMLNDDELAEVFNATGVPFGDAWFVPTLAPRSLDHEVSDIAYTLVRNWSENEVLYEFIRLAQGDTHGFVIHLNEYIADLTDAEQGTPLQFKYKQGDFTVVTEHGGYIFIDNDYEWTWARIESFVVHMESSIEFIREHFHITNTERISVTLYPFGVINVPASIVDLADILGWDAPDVNFVTNDEIILASTSRFGTWAMPHEVTHIMLFREFPAYRPATWMVEGMAVLGEILFRDYFDGIRTYRFNVPTTSNINTLARNSSGHVLPISYYEYTFGKDRWTYDEAGSFVFYLYNRFGMEPLLVLYQSNNETQFEIALDVFGEELDDLIKSWRRALWPGGEPRDWW